MSVVSPYEGFNRAENPYNAWEDPVGWLRWEIENPHPASLLAPMGVSLPSKMLENAANAIVRALAFAVPYIVAMRLTWDAYQGTVHPASDDAYAWSKNIAQEIMTWTDGRLEEMGLNRVQISFLRDLLGAQIGAVVIVTGKHPKLNA